MLCPLIARAFQPFLSNFCQSTSAKGVSANQKPGLLSPLASSTEMTSWQGLQPESDAGDIGDSKIPAYSKYSPSEPPVSNIPLQEEWVYWWRPDCKVKVLSKGDFSWRVRVAGERKVHSVPIEELVTDDMEDASDA